MRFIRLLTLFSILLSQTLAISQVRPFPRDTGNYFPFRPQTAINTLNFGRFPTGWSVPASRPVVLATNVPYPVGMDGQKFFTNLGVTHVENGILAPRLSLPFSKRWFMEPDHLIAEDALGMRSNYPVGSAEYNALTAYGQNGARYVTAGFDELWRTLGRYSYSLHFTAQYDIGSADIEVFAEGTTPQAMQAFKRKWTEGWLDERNARGHTTKLLTYGIATLAGPAGYVKNREQQDEPFRIPGEDWMGSNGRFDPNANPMVQKMRTGPITFGGRDQYPRETYDDRSVYQKNSDGSIKADPSGKALYVQSNFPTATVSNYGVNSRIYTNEAKTWVEHQYSELYKIQADWSYLCNRTTAQQNYDGSDTPGTIPYPRGTSDLNPAMTGFRLDTWERDNTEAGSQYNPAIGQMENIGEPESNRRRQNPRSQRLIAVLRGIFYHANVIWSDKGYADFKQTKIYPGQPDLSLGEFETMFAGSYQARNFPKLFEMMDAGKIDFIFPWKGVRKSNNVPNEYEWEKPIVALFKETGGLRVWAVWCWPAQDVNNPAHVRDMAVWVDLGDGRHTGSYKLKFKDRNVCVEGWTLPAGCENATAEMFRTQHTTLPVGSPTGYRVITRTGNYNVEWSGANPSPPAWVTSAANNTLSTGTTDTNTGGGNGFACSTYGGGQTLIVWNGSETIKAFRTDANVLYAAAASDGTNFKNRAWLTATGQFTTQQVACFSDTNPVTTTPPVSTTYPSMTAKGWIGPVSYGFYTGDNDEIHPDEKAAFLAAKAQGANCFSYGINWWAIDRGSYPGQNLVWGQLHNALRWAYENDLKIWIRIGGARQSGNVDGFIPDNARIRVQSGQVARMKGDYMPSPASAVAMARVEQWVERVATQIRDSPYRSAVLGVSTTLNPGLENDMIGRGTVGSGSTEQWIVTDYSASADSAWQAYLTARSLPIVALPAVNGAGTDSPYITFTSTNQKRFYDFRERVLAAATVRMDAAVVRILGSGVNRMVEFGSAFDDLSHLRGTSTILGQALLDAIPGIKLNNALDYPHAFSIALSLRDRAASRWAAQELDGIYNAESAPMIAHGVAAMQAGASAIFIANYGVLKSDLSGFDPVASRNRLAAVVAGIRSQFDMTQPRASIATRDTLTVSRAAIASANWGSIGLYDQFNTLNAQGGRVRIVINDNLN